MSAGSPLSAALVALGLLSVASGCTAISGSLDAVLGPAKSPASNTVATSDEKPTALSQLPTFTVRVQPSEGAPTEVKLPLPEPTYVQEVIEQSGATRRFKRMKIELYRPMPGGHHRLEVAYNRAKKRVAPAYDYSIYPGDQLVITEDPTNMLDDVMAKIPLSRLRR